MPLRDGQSRAALGLVLGLIVWASCSDLLSPSAPSIDDVAVLVGAGDIGVCGSGGTIATSWLLDNEPGTIFATGDIAYPDGTAEDFQKCYDPTWGRHKSRTRPAPGNHEYASGGATPYFDYFGSNAGPTGLGYYRYRTGAWQVYSLNSNADGPRAAAQIQWLKGEIAAQPSLCSIAYFHHPRFSSGPHGLEPVPGVVRDLWTTLYGSGVEVILAGHEHLYERFAPQTPEGRADSDLGIREFVVGTGGAALSQSVRRAANSEALFSEFGVLRLTLEPTTYSWKFLSAQGGTALDSGAGSCH